MYGDSRLRQLRELRERLQKWLGAHGTSSTAKLPLSAQEIADCIQAIEGHAASAEELRLEARALLAFEEAKPSDRYRAYAAARGLDATPGELAQKHDPRHVLSTYLTALNEATTVLTDGVLYELAGRTVKRVKLPPPPRTPRDALKATAEMHRFTTVEACRRYLFRIRDSIRDDRTGWRADYAPDFPLPRGE